MAWVIRFVPVVLLVSFLSFPAPSSGQTYGSGEIEYGGVRLQFSGQLTTAGTCQQPSANVIQCQVSQGTQGVIQLTATRTPPGAVNIRADAIPVGWPAFQVASGWGTVSKQYSFTVPSGSAGQRFELRFRAWTAGVVGEVELKCIIDATAPPSPKVPRIQVSPTSLDFGKVAVGSTVERNLVITNVGDDVLSIGLMTRGCLEIGD